MADIPQGLTIGQVAERTGLSVHTLRFYEREGILANPVQRAALQALRGRRASLRRLLAAPNIALDLPLKILVAEDAQGKVWLSYNSPAYLKQRHGIPDDLLQNIAGIVPICAEAVR